MEPMFVRFFGKEPEIQTSGAAGFDLKADLSGDEYVWLSSEGEGSRAAIHTGTYVEIPEGYVGLIAPRSGLALKKGLTVLNAPGVIDSDYRGEIKVILINHSGESAVVSDGERIAQLLIMPIAYVRFEMVPLESLSKTVRGTNGFGSTGLR